MLILRNLILDTAAKIESDRKNHITNVSTRLFHRFFIRPSRKQDADLPAQPQDAAKKSRPCFPPGKSFSF
jgi:hypothetical protein